MPGTELWEALNSKVDIPFLENGEPANWPIISLYTADLLENCQREFANCGLEEKFGSILETLFTEKCEDASPLIMRQNIIGIHAWISECKKSGDLLILHFDGDS